MATKPNQAAHYRRVPKILLEMREAAKLTQRELAVKVKRPQWWVHRAETGSRRLDVVEFVLWCRGCGQDPSAVIGDFRPGIPWADRSL